LSRPGQKTSTKARIRASSLLAIVLLVAAACSNSTLPGGARVNAADQRSQLDANGVAQPSNGTTPGAAGSLGAAGPLGAGGQTAAATGGESGAGGIQGVAATGGGASGSTVGITDNEITISVSAAFSGVYGQLSNQLFDVAATTWQKEVNSNGGIYGRQIKLVKVDNQGSADGAISACKEATSNGSFMVWNMTGAYVAEDACEDAAGMPVFDANPSAMDPSWRSVIALTLGTQFAPAEVSFVKSQYANAGNSKIGIIYTGDVARYASQYDAVSAALLQAGLQLVHSEKISQNQTSFVSQMSRMRDAGVQFVMLYVGLEAPGIIRDSQAIGYSPQYYAGPISGAATDLGARSTGPLYNGVIGTRPFTTSETPAYAQFIANVRKYNGDSAAASAQDFELPVYGAAVTIGKLLEVAGHDLTRESFVASAKEVQDYDNGYLVPFTLKGKAIPVGQAAVFPIGCCQSDNTWKSLGPAGEQF
jgi:ABC-type branched-subunit amino acid transport system substrate-binding protein